MFNYLNEYAARIHEDNAKWWRDPKTGNKIDWPNGIKHFLVISELVEAGEGERKELNDDKLKHRPMAEVELADTIIRIFDYVGAKKYDLDNAMSSCYPTLRDKRWPAMQVFFNQRFFRLGDHKGKQLMQIVCAVCKIFELEEAGATEFQISTGFIWLLALICDYAAIHDYDLDGAIKEKRAFNATREDHTDKARMSAGGKKW